MIWFLKKWLGSPNCEDFPNEIEDTDEEKLDISEGVSKGAYEKQHMQVVTKLACCSLYRRSVPWIVARGGPCAARKSAKHSHRSRMTSVERETDRVRERYRYARSSKFELQLIYFLFLQLSFTPRNRS